MMVDISQAANRFYESSTGKTSGEGRVYFTIVGLDVDAALKRLANRWDFYDRLVSRFYTEHLDFFDRLHHEQGLGNFELVHRMLHSLKGISGTIGATELYPLSTEAEQAYKAKLPEAIGLISQAELCLTRLLLQIKHSNCFSIPND
jgi:HPt (histidine-containing phosphotransfer) domain-containing protein